MRSQPGRSIARCVRILAPLALLAGLLPPFLPGVTTVRARPLPGSTFQSPLPPPALETTFESPLPFPPLPGSDEKTASSSTGLLALAYSVTPARALPGDVVTCTLTAASAAESTLQEAALVTRLPAGVQVLEAEGADHNLEEGELRWSLGRVGPGRVVTLTVRVRVPPDAGQSLLQTRAVLTASATPSSLTADGPVDVEVSAEAVATLRVGQVVTATLTPAGGRLASPDRQVRVVAPDGVTTLADGWVELDAPPGAVSEPTPVTLTVFPEQALGPREMGMALRFSLEPDLTFATPVTLSVGLQGLVPFGHLRAGWWPYLVTLSDPGRFEWEDVPLRSVDWEAGVITTQLEHFSEYGSGVISENGWQLLFNDAQVEHFRGALSYRIPLQVPAGRGGLQPNVVLDYNSDRIDGILAEIQSDWAGLGWSLDAPQIVRSVEWCTWPGEICTDTSHPKLTLVIDGAGYRLVPAEGDDPVNPNEVTPTWGMGRYYADREPSLYVEKQGTGESGVETYWIVRTPDGVEYRFGFTEDARQVLTHVEGLGSAVYRWRLDRIRDPLGNEVVFEYDEPLVGSGFYGERASFLSKIYYNRRADDTWGTRIVFVRHSREGDPDGEAPQGALFHQPDYLHRVQVWNDDQLIREYGFEYNFGEARRLWRITEYGLGGEAGGEALPQTTFGYQLFDNYQGIETYPYSRLVSVDNGYDGRIEIDYDHEWINDAYGYHCRVQEQRTLDGMGHTALREYEYGPACMDATDSKCDDGNRAWGLKGYEWSAVTTHDYDATTLNVITRTFVLTWPLTGRVGLLEIADDAGVVHQQTETTWGHTWLISATGEYETGFAFLYVDSLEEKSRGDAAPAVTLTSYEYDAYGNVTQEQRWGNPDLTGDEVVLVRDYVPNEPAWIVGLPSREEVSTGGWGTALQETRYLYDDQSWGISPTLGVLTALQVGAGNLWATTTYEHDDYGNVTAITDTLGRTARTGYDTTYHVYPVSATNALTQTGYTEWDLALGVPLTATAINGAATRYAYDAFGRLVSVTGPDPETGLPASVPDLSYTYPTPVDGEVEAPFAIGTAQRVGYGTYHHAWTLYDGTGRSLQAQEEVDDGVLVLAHSGYDARGLVVTATLPVTAAATGGSYVAPNWGALYATTTAYDALGRETLVTAPDGEVTRWTYDGWQGLVLDARGHQVISERDGQGRLLAVRECAGTFSTPTWITAGVETRYWYDARGLLTAVRDGEGNVTHVEYDALGRKVAMQDPSMGHWEYGYNLAGNLITQTDALSQTLIFAYDDLNRLERETLLGGDVLAEYGYDQGAWGVGQRTAMTDTTGVTGWAYDARGRVVSETRVLTGDLGTYSTGWQYDAAGRVAAIHYPTGETVSPAYDARGLVRSVIGTIGPAPWVYLNGASYDAAGQVTWQNWGNGLETTYAYQPETLRLTQIHLAPGGVVTPLLDLAYDYDPVGNVAVLTDTARAEVASFTYDERDRLVEAGGPYSETYGLSDMGNILTRTVEGEVRGYTYGETEVITTPVPGGLTPRMYLPLIVTPPGYPGAPPATTGQPFAVQALSTGGRFAYDANGNMVERVVVSGTQVTTYTQAFDSMNRLVVVTNTVSAVVTHIGYDAGGARIWQSDGTTTTVYLGDPIEVAIGPSRRITRTYYYAGGQRAAVRVAEDGHEQLYYLHGDHLGSVSLATYGQARPLYLHLYLPVILRDAAGGGETLALGEGDEVTGDATTPEPFLSPLSLPTFDSPLLPPQPEESGGGEILETTFASPLEPPEPGEPLEGSETRYRPYGEVRTEGVPVGGLTDYAFTGQALDANTGLMYYRARWYDPYLGRWIQADTIVPAPEDPQDLSRYSYVRNSPLRYTDPGGHRICQGRDCQEPEVPAGWPPSVPGHLRPRRPYPTGIPSWDRVELGTPPGSWRALYIEAYNLGLAPWQGNPLGSIDDRFNPFYARGPASGGSLTYDVYYDMQPIADELYSPYGGLDNLRDLVVERCRNHRCNNPLNDEDFPMGRMTDHGTDAAALIVGSGSNLPIRMFLRQLPERPGWEFNEWGWNYERYWVELLMRLHNQQLLESQFRFLDIYRQDPNLYDFMGRRSPPIEMPLPLQ